MGAFRNYIVRAGRAVVRDLTQPPYTVGGHFYSPLTTTADRKRAIASRRAPAAVDLRQAEQLRLAGELDLSQPSSGRWQQNEMFGAADASVLRGLLLHFKPKRYVEVGSGYSTALALDVADVELPELRITCVEPYADRLRSRLRPGDTNRLTLLEQPLQEVDIAQLVNDLEPGDVFFIDSTHVVKAGSDVLWLLLRVLPQLPDGVIVHIHDIHWPFEYPDDWLHEGRDWNEAYFVHAFLAYNERFQILLFGDWLAHEHPEVLSAGFGPSMMGSLWLRKSV